MKLKISTDFSTAPGPRKISEGKFSGELFKREKLLPIVLKAIEAKDRLCIDLDGTSGFGTSFLEESFGGLIREDGIPLKVLNETLRFVSEDEPELLDEIREYLEDANKARTLKS
jgi:hypothetical protein